MYKMSYYRYVRAARSAFFDVQCPSLRVTHSFPELYGGGPAVDRVRGQTIPADPIKLDTLGEFSVRQNGLPTC
jgi:hypothetical protein